MKEKIICYGLVAYLSGMMGLMFLGCGAGFFRSDSEYMEANDLTVEEALEMGVLEHPEDYSGHCDFEAMEKSGIDEQKELDVLFSIY